MPEIGQPSRAPVFLTRASERVLAIERRAVGLLMMLLGGAVLLNVVTRYLGLPIYWIDEFSIYCMVWLTFFGASVMSRLRLDFAVTMLTDRLSPRIAAVVRVCSTLMVLGFAAALALMCWIWFDPRGIAAAGFDAGAYAGKTFNFLYTERTQTLNWPTWIVYLIMPVFALSITLHTLANLLEDLGLAPPVRRDLLVNADAAVN
jgi:TRAP-type C4-dicarboxylate transport system permease small subunit